MCLAPHPAPPAVDRILVIHLGGLGDVVRALPAVSSLRGACAGAHLAWLVAPGAATALIGQPWIDEVLVLPRAALRGDPRAGARRLAGLARALRARRFELVLDFQSVARSALLGLLSGAPRRVSYARPLARELSWLVANDRAELSPVRASRFAHGQALVRHLGIEAEPSERPLALDPAARARMAAALGGGPAPVALHAGASSAAPGGRYGAASYAAVARALRDRCGAHSIATWGPAPGDRAAAEALVAASGGAARLAPETPSVADLAALLAACRLFIGTDAGPLHVASLVHTPVVQILGPGDPLESAPWSRTPSRSVGGPGRALRAVSPESVVDAALELLLAGPSGS